MTTLLLVWHPALLGTLGPARPLLYPAEAAEELRLIDAGGLPLAEAVAAALQQLELAPLARWRLLIAAPAAPFESELPAALAPLLGAAGLERIALLLLDGPADSGAFGDVAARFGHLDLPGPLQRVVVRAPDLLERARSAPHALGYLLLYLAGDAANLPFESVLRPDGVRVADDLAPLYARYRLGLERALHELETAPVEVAAQLYDEEVQPGDGIDLPETERELVPDHGAPRPEIPSGWIARRARERDHDAWLLWHEGAERELLGAEGAIDGQEKRTLTGGLERLSELREARIRRASGGRLDRDALRERRSVVEVALNRLAAPTAPGSALTLPRWDRSRWQGHDRAFRHALARRPALPQLIGAPLLALTPLLLASFADREQGAQWLALLAGLGFVAALVLTVDAVRRPLLTATQMIRGAARERLQALAEHQKGGRRLIAAQLELWQMQQNGRVLDAAEAELRLRTRLHAYHEAQLRRHLSWQREIAASLPTVDVTAPAELGETDWDRDVLDLHLYQPSAYAEGGAPPRARCDESELVLPLPRFAGLAGIDLTAARRS